MHLSNKISNFQYLSSIFILSYILPLSIIISCYSRIIVISINSAKVAKARENIGSKKPSSRSKGSRDQKVTRFYWIIFRVITLRRIILVLVVTFFCCWTPFHFRNLLRVLNVHLYHSTCSLIDDLANIGQFQLQELFGENLKLLFRSQLEV